MFLRPSATSQGANRVAEELHPALSGHNLIGGVGLKAYLNLQNLPFVRVSWYDFLM